jgi:hypothetical protein
MLPDSLGSLQDHDSVASGLRGSAAITRRQHAGGGGQTPPAPLFLKQQDAVSVGIAHERAL